MCTVEEAIDVAVPVSVAYNQWTQFESFPRFMSTVRGVEQIRPNLTRWVIGAGPLRYEFHAEIVEQVPDSVVAWRSLSGCPGHRGEVSFHVAADGLTAVVVRVRLEPRRVTDLVSRQVVQRLLRAELRRFKRFIEGLGRECGAWRGVIRDGHVQPQEPAPPRSRVPHWPVG